MGKVALVERGTCDFALKVAHAQAQGAVLVLVLNNVVGPAELMYPSLDYSNASIRIPSAMVAQADADALVQPGLVFSFPIAMPHAESEDEMSAFSSHGPTNGPMRLSHATVPR